MKVPYIDPICLLLFLQTIILVKSEGFLSKAENEQLQATCGRKQSHTQKAMNSENATIAQAPWVVSVSENGNTLCTGTLISSRHVVIAAHCFMHKHTSKEFDTNEKKSMMYFKTPSPQELNFGLGDECSERDDKTNCVNNGTGLYRFTRARRFWYTTGHYEMHKDDIAIVELESDIRSKGIIPICLSTESPKEKEFLEFYGFGIQSKVAYLNDKRLDVLQKITTQVVNCNIEDEKVRRLDRADRVNDFCTRSNRKQHTCNGDSGGGMVSQDSNGVYSIRGVASASINCEEVYPNYTFVEENVAVAPFVGWICTKTGICPQGYHQSQRMETDKEGELIESRKLTALFCDNDYQLFTVKGTKTLCLQVFEYDYVTYDVAEARRNCETRNATLAPMRTETEIKTLMDWDMKFGSGRSWPKWNQRYIVNAEYSEKYQEFQWLIDYSKVKRDYTLWVRGKSVNVDEYGRKANCLAMKWITPTLMKYEPISCGHKERAFVCAKRPKIRIERKY